MKIMVRVLKRGYKYAMLRIICPLYIWSKCKINENYEENFETYNSPFKC